MTLGRLHVLTDTRDGPRRARGGAGLRCPAGAPVVQVRAKDGTDRELYDLAARVAAAVRRRRRPLPRRRPRRRRPRGRRRRHPPRRRTTCRSTPRDGSPVRTTCSAAPPASPAWRARWSLQGADYLGVGPAYATSTKDGLPDPLGPAARRRGRRAVDVPVIAIGGITVDRVPELLAAGAHGVAVVAAVSGRRRPGRGHARAAAGADGP